MQLTVACKLCLIGARNCCQGPDREKECLFMSAGAAVYARDKSSADVLHPVPFGIMSQCLRQSV